MSTSTVSINILDKDYQVACPEEEKAALIKAGQHLDEQMRTIRASGKIIGLERIAVMAALNISYELLQQDGNAKPSEQEQATVQRLGEEIDETLHRCRQLEIS